MLLGGKKMHKEEAAKLFSVLADGDRVKIVKMLYNRGNMDFETLSLLIGSVDNKFSSDISLLMDHELIGKDKDLFFANKARIDELMKFISTPCGCSKH